MRKQRGGQVGWIPLAAAAAVLLYLSASPATHSWPHVPGIYVKNTPNIGCF
jgi:hypothetical protein